MVQRDIQMKALQGLTYELVTNVTQNTVILVAIILSWIIPIILLLVIGATRKARTVGGKYVGKAMIETPNFWIVFLIWFLLYPALLSILVIFPIWLKIFGV